MHRPAWTYPRPMRNPWLLVWLACAALLVPPRARAEATAADKAAAEVLFDQGLELMRDGKYTEACARLEQSNRVDHGIGTMLYLAECYAKLGRTASAWALFREASSEAAAASQLDRAEAGKQRAQELEPNLTRLRIEATEPVPDGMVILRDGSEVPRGLPIPVDPGEHQIEARAPGYQPYRESVQVHANAAVQEVRIPALERAPEPQTASKPPAAPAPAPTQEAAPNQVGAPSQASRADAPERPRQAAAGLALGGAGIAVLAVGAGFGLRAILKNNDAEARCPDNVCDDAGGLELTDEANQAARISNGMFLAGGALLIAGAIVYWTAPRARKVRAAVSLDSQHASVHLGGAF